jgi:hypothetical protein
MSSWKCFSGLLAACFVYPVSTSTADVFQRQVAPFIKTHCVECHNATKHEGELDLTRYTTAGSLGEHFRQWEHVLTFVKKGEMPPETAKQPADAERAAFLSTLRQLLADQARDLSGDPGVVLPRRLTAAEFNYTIRDLTGVDIRPADSFPIDPASGEGFSNTGEALVMSPNLFKKYYAAAQFVADHAVLTPTEIRFAPYPVTTFADRTKYHEQALVQFYARHDVAYEKYLTAAWSYRHRPADRKSATIEAWAEERQLSPKYLRQVWDLLSDASGDAHYLGAIRTRWNALPSSDAKRAQNPPEPTREIAALAAYIRRLSLQIGAKETPAIVSNAGNAPIAHLERRKKTAVERDTVDPNLIAERGRLHRELKKRPDSEIVRIVIQAAHEAGSGGPGLVILSDLKFSEQSASNYRPGDKKNESLREVLLKHSPEQWERLRPGRHPLGHAIAADAVALSTDAPLEIEVPAQVFGDRQNLRFFAEATLDREHAPQALLRVAIADRPTTPDDPAILLGDPQSPPARLVQASAAAFCRTFPNRFVYVDDTRGLSAGFHLIEGLFRDDAPLCKLVLDDAQNAELNRLWEEMYFGTGMVEKMLRGFVFFERSERNFLKHADFDSFKEEDPALVEPATLDRFEQAYLLRSGVKSDDPERERHPVHLFFDEIRRGLRRRAEQSAAAKPKYLEQLATFAERAYRRPLSPAERAGLRRFYDSATSQSEVDLEQAVRGVVTSILVSPYFSCRVDPAPEGNTVKPLADLALASRLSYLLWASMPDAELLALAKAGNLNNEATLREQVRRMREDPKVAGMALEFFGQWLRYREFLSAEAVDRAVFPNFNDALKQAMFEEPTRLATHLLQNNLPVTDLLYGDATFVNGPLAAHYGLPHQGAADEWRRVDGLHRLGRGGVLGMAVFLTSNSQPQRTSPVKRGFWVVHKILGEHIPAPPNDVAVLPAKETETDGKTIRQLLALHTEERACARCHQRFDGVGLSMEGFDPIGKRREKDLAGRPVDDGVPLPSGNQARGVPQYLEHLRATRHDDFIQTLCQKFLGYALGRSLEISDHQLLEQMQTNLERDDYRLATLLETVVCSPQFRNQRCRNFSIDHFRAESSGE